MKKIFGAVKSALSAIFGLIKKAFLFAWGAAKFLTGAASAFLAMNFFLKLRYPSLSPIGFLYSAMAKNFSFEPFFYLILYVASFAVLMVALVSAIKKLLSKTKGE